MSSYLKLEGLEGGITDANHAGWSEVSSVSYGIVNHGADRANHQQQRTMRFHPIGVVRSSSDHLTPQLLKLVGEAAVIPSVVIETTSGDANRRLLRRITVTNATLRELHPLDSATSSESLEFEGEMIKYEFAHSVSGVMSTVTWNNVTQRFED